MENEQKKMSKYARKQLAKIRGTWSPPPGREPQATVRDALPPLEPRGQIAPMGTLPVEAACALEGAAQQLREAEGMMREILGRSKQGIQQAEPRAILQFIIATAGRVEGMVPRARGILGGGEGL